QTQAAYLNAAATEIPSSLRATDPEPVLGNAEIQFADLQDWDDLESDPVEVTDDLTGPGLALPDDLPLAIDLEDLDLGEVPVDEDITLFQLDEEITRLQLDSGLEGNELDDDDTSGILDGTGFEADVAQADAAQSEDNTVAQRSPWSDISAQATPEQAADAAAIADAAGTETELDALYESLFGEPDAVSAIETDELTATSLASDRPLDADSSLDQVLLATDSDLTRAASPEGEIAPAFDGLAPDDLAPDDLASDDLALDGLAPDDLALDALTPDDESAAKADDTDAGDTKLPVDRPLQDADLDVEDLNAALNLEALDQALEQSLELFEMPTVAPPPEATPDNLSATPTLADLLGPDEIPEPDHPDTEAGLAAHTIASLAELLPATSETVTPLFEGISLDLDMDEDSFIPAPSDEDLLSNPPGATPWDPELKLTADALDQLSADLLNLENAVADAPLDFEAIATPDPGNHPTHISSTEDGSQQAAASSPPESEDAETLDLDNLLPELSDLALTDPHATDETAADEATDPLSLDRQLDPSIESVPGDRGADAPADRADQDLTLQAFALDDTFAAESTDWDSTAEAAAEPDEDILALLEVWTADSDRPQDGDSSPDPETEPDFSLDNLPPETEPDFSLDNFADELVADPPAPEPPSSEPLSLDDEPFTLSLDDVSFELDLPALAKNYVGEEVTPPTDDDSWAAFEGDLDPSPPSIASKSDDLERFSLGEIDLNLNLDLEPDLRFEIPSDLDDDLFADRDEAGASEAEARDPRGHDPVTRRADSQRSAPDASKITTLESLNELELFTQEDGDQDTNESNSDPDTPSRITTLESLSDLEATVADEVPPLTDPQIEDGIDLFSDQDGAEPTAKVEVDESTATIPLSLGSLDLFPNDGAHFGDTRTDEAAEGSDLDTLALLSEMITRESGADQPGSADPDPTEGTDSGPIELFPNDEATATQDIGTLDSDLDLADPGLLDLFPPLTPEPEPISEAEDNLNVAGADDWDGLNSRLDNEVTNPDPAPAEALAPPLALDDLLALDEPEPTLPEEWEPAALQVEPNPANLLTELEGLGDANELDTEFDAELDAEHELNPEHGPEVAPETPETSPPNLSLEALGLAEDADLLADFQVPDPVIAPLTEPVVNGAIASSAQLVPAPTDILPTQPPDPPITEPTDPDQEWFLGLDFGTTGISAVLMNRLDGQAYPLYWTDTGIASTTAETLFRLPTVAVFNADGDQDWTLGATGPSALTLNWQGEAATTGRSRLATQMKAWLAVGVPYQDGEGHPQPQVQWSNRDPLPLPQVMAATQALLNPLSLLKQTRYGDGETTPVGAAGLDTAHLQRALQQLQGVIVGHGIAASETYRLNLREVILATQLVPSASQVLFVEAAIAAVLSGLPDPSQPLAPGNQTQTLYQCQWQGGTVMINAGASGTDLGIVNLPNPLSALGREDFTLRSLAYGGDALDLDIISQLLVPADRRQTRSPGSKPAQGSGWDWQAASPGSPK
ncbi:MAG: hypothetical protein HC812_03235, partial [Leptolyngbya sp. RL_3_1]|nr:hypothetical protein [Leptolyngbya sp. RL_3_1]